MNAYLHLKEVTSEIHYLLMNDHNIDICKCVCSYGMYVMYGIHALVSVLSFPIKFTTLALHIEHNN